MMVKLASRYRILDGFHAARVLVLGDVMLDRFVYGSVQRISPEAPIPVVNVERFVDTPGGAANVARNIAALGARVALVGVVGADSWAADLHTQLACSPTIEARLVTDPARPTSVKTRYVADGQQVMRADRESRSELSQDLQQPLLHEFSEALRDASVVVLSDYAKGVLTESVISRAIDLARRAGKTVIADPKAKNFAKYRGATVMTPNRLELQQACGAECVNDDQVVAGAQRIVTEGTCEVMLVTRGKDGMTVVQRNGTVLHLPTTAREVFDVSGAGDTVVATVSLALAAGAKIGEAAALANTAAGIVVGKRGTATVTTGEIVAALATVDERVQPQKIFARETAVQLARAWRGQGLKIAFANGCFDLLHPGHISLLDQGRRSADRLIVGLNSDLSIRRLKGPNRPVQSEVARATLLSAMKSVDAVVIFSEDTPLELIHALEPDVLVKGAEYTMDNVVGADFVTKRGGKVLLAELLTGHSTTETVKRVANLSA
jgi:D-beta-D-heptose 7-phosphate kinase / D-beta-D-heptose 1-phosphate adenosyltransferase